MQKLLENKFQTPRGEITLPDSPSWYTDRLPELVQELSTDRAMSLYRFLCKYDLYFLLRFVLSSKEIKIKVKDDYKFWEHPWIFNRCREVQFDPDNHLDLWARGHGKSTIITFGLSIQNILNNPDITIGIFSSTRPLAKTFLRHIKSEFEQNGDLKKLFPEILWIDPKKEAPKWSEDDGIIVKRSSNPRESTVEAWGVIEGQPVGRHFDLRIYDDVIEESTVTNIDQIKKAKSQWQLSTNLGKPGGKQRYIGTRYHFADLYGHMIEQGVVKPRIRPALNPPRLQDSESVFFPKEFIEEKFLEQGPVVFSAQQLLNPIAESVQGLDSSCLQYYNNRPTDIKDSMNIIITVDAANEKKKTSDYTAIWVVGLNYDRNFYILDGVRDRLNLKERLDLLFMLHSYWRPYEVRYERYGLMADIGAIQILQDQRNYRFAVTEVAGATPKEDRIRRLVPILEDRRLYAPSMLFRQDYQGIEQDLIKELIFEMDSFPAGMYDDMIDSLSRIMEPDLGHMWPDFGTPVIHSRFDKWLRELDNPQPASRTWKSA